MINRLLFVYGSLLDAGNEFAAHLSRNSTPYSTGNIKGRLYDIGEYPGTVIDANGYPIQGSILSLNNPDKNLKILDDYEGFGDEQEKPNLFIRQLLPVETESGNINCWVYLYNLPVEGLHEIKSGDYLAYILKKKP